MRGENLTADERRKQFRIFQKSVETISGIAPFDQSNNICTHIPKQWRPARFL